MRYCVNPLCQKPENTDTADYCRNCNSGLLLNNRFRPIQMIGQGGFGRTFLAVDEHCIHESKCLIKQFSLQNSTTPPNSRINIQAQTIIPGQQAINKVPDIYRQEVAQLSKLKHPQIPILITHFEQDGYAYLVQEFIDGINLATELNRQGAFSEAQIWQVIEQLLPVLKFIHEQGVIHRDIKPENIIRPIDNKKPLILVDFGAAKLVAPQTSTNRVTANMATCIGTPSYMAPEQEKGRVVFASDLYSLGVTCICLFTNASPAQLFDDGSNSWEWRSRIKKVGKNLGEVLDKLLELGTKNRYKSADDVMQNIDLRLNSSKRQNRSIGLNKTARIQAQQNLISIWEKIAALGTGAQGLAALVALAITLGLIKVLTPASTDAMSTVSISSDRGINYSQLREYLRRKEWQAADAETYELILKISAPKSQSRGYIKYDEISNLSCTDLQTIDNLWRTASDGKLGFSAQQLIYEKQGKSWQKMYDMVGWGSFKDGKLEKTIEQEFDWQNRRMRYKQGMEPNFQDPLPGSLPVTSGIVQKVAFPQFAESCKF